MTQNNWQWVAFLFDGADELFLKSNPLFVKRSGNGNSSTEEFDDWWEFFDEAQNSPRFFLLKCDGRKKSLLGSRLMEKKVSAEEDTFLDYQLFKWTQEFGGNGVVFLHWHNDWDSSRKKTEALQTFMIQRYPSVVFRCVSSQMPKTQYGSVFNTNDPVIPIAGFDRWFEMFEVFWTGGAQGVNEQYTKDTFPCHRNLSASSKAPQAASEDKSSPLSVRQDLPCGDSPQRKEDVTPAPVGVGRWSRIAVWLPRIEQLFLCFSKYVVGLVAGLLSLEPLLAMRRYLPVEAFRELTLKAKVAMLLLVFLSAIFATCVWGGLFRVLMGNSAKPDK